MHQTIYKTVRQSSRTSYIQCRSLPDW